MFSIWTIILVVALSMIEGFILKSLIDDIRRCKINRIETTASRIHNSKGVELPY